MKYLLFYELNKKIESASLKNCDKRNCVNPEPLCTSAPFLLPSLILHKLLSAPPYLTAKPAEHIEEFISNWDDAHLGNLGTIGTFGAFSDPLEPVGTL